MLVLRLTAQLLRSSHNGAAQLVTLERRRLGGFRCMVSEGQPQGEQTPNPRLAPKWRLVGSSWRPTLVTRGATTCRRMTRDRDVHCSENPNWRTHRLDADRWTQRSQVLTHRGQKRWTREQLVGRDIDTCWKKAADSSSGLIVSSFVRVCPQEATIAIV